MYEIVKRTEVISLGKENLKERIDEIFQIFEKSFYRKHII